MRFATRLAQNLKVHSSKYTPPRGALTSNRNSPYRLSGEAGQPDRLRASFSSTLLIYHVHRHFAPPHFTEEAGPERGDRTRLHHRVTMG